MRIMFMLILFFAFLSCVDGDKTDTQGEKAVEEAVIDNQATLKSGRVIVNGNTKILRVLRVFMHGIREFSFLVETKENKRAVLRSVSNVFPEFVPDVPAGQYMWVQVKHHAWKSNDEIIIHLHSWENIEGGGWNNGKAGPGQTIPLE